MSWAPEDRLLINCSRVCMTDETVAVAARLLQQPLDWEYILEASIKHSVSPLLYHGLRQVLQDGEEGTPGLPQRQSVPTHVMEELGKLYQNSRLRNQRLYGVVRDMCEAFGRVGVQAMGLKDVLLARDVYPDIGLRPMGDIDILIRREDYKKVAACMARLGFVPVPNPDLQFILKYADAHHFQRPRDNVWVDIQWNVLEMEWDTYREGSFDFEIDRMWRGASTGEAGQEHGDYRLLAPRPEDMLFQLCLHLEGHAYCELVLFCDIVELLRHYSNRLDWGYLTGIAKKYKVESSIYYVLLLVQRMFNVALPESLLEELEPSYFKANVVSPLFDSLTRLYVSLDEIRLSARPPRALMNELEVAVRRETMGAMQLYKAIDRIAATFISSGGQPIVLGGSSLGKVAPGPPLRTAEEIRLYISDHQLPLMRQVLSDLGARSKDSPGSERFVLPWATCLESRDPVLAGKPTTITLQGAIERDLNQALPQEDSGGASKKSEALRLLKGKLGRRRRETGAPAIELPVKIVALSPEEMLVCLSAQVGGQKQNRLFAACSLLEFFRGYSDPLDWQQVATAARRYGVAEMVCEGLLIAGELLDDTLIPPDAPRLLACSEQRPRVLEWARYDPDSWGRYTGLKKSFFFLFTFLSLAGSRARFKYLVESLVGKRGMPVLPGVISELIGSSVSMLGRKPRAATDFAYWTEPEIRDQGSDLRNQAVYRIHRQAPTTDHRPPAPDL